MNTTVRLLVGLCLAPAVPALMLVVAALPSPGVVLPIAKTLLLYGYLATFLAAAPILLIFRRRFAQKPALVIPLAGCIGMLIAALPFLAALVSGELKASDWPSFLALVPAFALGAMLGTLSGVAFFLISRPSLRTGTQP